VPGVWTVAANGLSADMVAQLAEFAYDAHAPPAGVLPGQAPDEIPNLSGDRRPAPSPPAPPGPVVAPGCALPSDYCLWLHQHQGRPPARPDAREPGLEQPVRWVQPPQAPLAGEDGKLLAESKVLQ